MDFIGLTEEIYRVFCVNPLKHNVMKNTEVIVTLPNKVEMMKRLITVSDNSDFQKRLYPLFLDGAGRKVHQETVIYAITCSIKEYSDGNSSIEKSTFELMSKFIEAIVADESISAQIVKYWKDFLEEV